MITVTKSYEVKKAEAEKELAKRRDEATQLHPQRISTERDSSSIKNIIDGIEKVLEKNEREYDLAEIIRWGGKMRIFFIQDWELRSISQNLQRKTWEAQRNETKSQTNSNDFEGLERNIILGAI